MCTNLVPYFLYFIWKYPVFTHQAKHYVILATTLNDETFNGLTEPCGGYGIRGSAYNYEKGQCDCLQNGVIYGSRCLQMNPVYAANGMMSGRTC